MDGPEVKVSRRMHVGHERKFVGARGGAAQYIGKDATHAGTYSNSGWPPGAAHLLISVRIVTKRSIYKRPNVMSRRTHRSLPVVVVVAAAVPPPHLSAFFCSYRNVYVSVPVSVRRRRVYTIRTPKCDINVRRRNMCTPMTCSPHDFQSRERRF